MTEEDIKKLEAKYSETKIQHICVEWFRNTFPNVAGLLFAIPNGGTRTKKSGFMRKYEGAIAGVADLILLQMAMWLMCIFLIVSINYQYLPIFVQILIINRYYQEYAHQPHCHLDYPFRGT